MAFAAMFRRSSSVVPLAIRAVGRQRQIHNSALATVIKHSCGSRQIYRSSFPSVLRYSTLPNSDQSLIKIIESEIDCADEAEQVEGIPDELAFEIVDIPGPLTVTLKRKYQNETISVNVQMLSLVISEVSLVVRITKNSGPFLEFDCTSYPDEIVINKLSYKDPNAPEDQLPYEANYFVDLDENLQEALNKYLEIRGIKPSAVSPSALNFLWPYMIQNDNREYKQFLENLKGFIEA